MLSTCYNYILLQFLLTAQLRSLEFNELSNKYLKTHL